MAFLNQRAGRWSLRGHHIKARQVKATEMRIHTSPRDCTELTVQSPQRASAEVRQQRFERRYTWELEHNSRMPPVEASGAAALWSFMHALSHSLFLAFIDACVRGQAQALGR